MRVESTSWKALVSTLRAVVLGVVVATLVMSAAATSETSAETTEMPNYTVVSTEGQIEIRDYPSIIVAELTAEGERGPAIMQGFRGLADYIFGGNAPSQKIAMTAPVTQQATPSGVWRVQFMMPSQYTLASLPKPKNSAITLKEMAKLRYATIRFGGNSDDEALLAEQLATLKGFMDRNSLVASAEPVYAFYDPPWIAPEKRRNEIHIALAN
jgi:DNA gyrase inhibitor GyrI